MKKMSILLAAAMAAVCGAVAHATLSGDGDLHAHVVKLLHGDGKQRERIEAHLDAAAATLELSAAQRKQVATLLEAALPGLETRALALADAHAEQIELMHAPELDEDALRAASTRLGTAVGELAVAAAHTLHDVHGVLGPEQRKKLELLHGPNMSALFTDHIRGFGQAVRSWTGRQ